MTRITAAIDAAIADLEWFKIPHTVDQVIGLHAEATGDGGAMRWRHGTSNDDIVASLAGGGFGGGSTDPAWSDPTCAAALRSDPADGDTITAMDWACRHIAEDARQLSWAVADILGHGRRTPPQPRPGRQNLVASAVEHLHHSRPHIEAAEAWAEHYDHLHELAVYRIGENAAWLHAKGEAIWQATRGASLPVATQRDRRTCEVCTPLGRDVTPERGDRCNRCRDFIREHKGLHPTAKIARWWEDHPRSDTPPRLVLEARHEATEAKRRRA